MRAETRAWRARQLRRAADRQPDLALTLEQAKVALTGIRTINSVRSILKELIMTGENIPRISDYEANMKQPTGTDQDDEAGDRFKTIGKPRLRWIGPPWGFEKVGLFIVLK
jgi:hypothetical protein